MSDVLTEQRASELFGELVAATKEHDGCVAARINDLSPEEYAAFTGRFVELSYIGGYRITIDYDAMDDVLLITMHRH